MHDVIMRAAQVPVEGIQQTDVSPQTRPGGAVQTHLLGRFDVPGKGGGQQGNIVPAMDESAGQIDGIALRPAASRVGVLNDQGDFHAEKGTRWGGKGK